ncbi:hypothetical protein BC940DRAFT_289502 [Gongronella butleri]|nr:hypothetical protein BC940DRAFT_289502 [Gongronella butleri]
MQIITKALTEVQDGYDIAGIEWDDGTRSDVVYCPRPAVAAALAPIIVEVQNKVTPIFMSRLIGYCLHAKAVYGRLPTVLVFCVSGFSPQSMQKEMVRDEKRSWLYSASCNWWAVRCSIIYIKEDADFGGDEDNNNIEPLFALASFFNEQQPVMHAHSLASNAIIQQLYYLAMTETQLQKDYSENYAAAMNAICKTHELLYSKALKSLKMGKTNAHTSKILGRGLSYTATLKRKYSIAECDDSSSATDEEHPDYSPIASSSSPAPGMRKRLKDIEFVDQYRKNLKPLRMNWSACLKDGKAAGLFELYNTSESLRSNIRLIREQLKQT